MSDMVMHYGLFLAETATVVVAIGVVIALVAASARRGAEPERLEVRNVNERLERFQGALSAATLPRRRRRAEARVRKRRARERTGAERKRLFVIDFHGDLRASATTQLREEVSAVLGFAREGDEVLVRVENAGGLVHEHGLAAAQLLRVRSRGIPLTAAVDKVAASGGYMMACTADRIVAAPFAVLGSIGVLLQLPNFHRWLEERGIDFEQIKGGEHKRHLTVFGRNTEEDRVRSRLEVEETHGLFRDFVAAYRPGLDLSRVGTGEHWYGSRALELGLCDELRTSDEMLLEACADTDVYEVRYKRKTPWTRKLAPALEGLADAATERWWRHQREQRLARG